MNSNPQNINPLPAPEETTGQVFLFSWAAIAGFLSLIIFLA
ncbi:hypothetical protein [Merismopedia glauca]|nr:hypothetical protein [Merismopedia glauca]